MSFQQEGRPVTVTMVGVTVVIGQQAFMGTTQTAVTAGVLRIAPSGLSTTAFTERSGGVGQDRA
jgi:hypothetical protein